jgi:FkbM family methyltransferase
VAPVGPALDALLRRTVERSSAGSFFECEFNGVVALLPRDTLRTMTHCCHARPDAPFLVAVETGHLDWMRDRLRPGDLFLDVGAATGAMTLPVALGRPQVTVIAFEPSRTARRLLADTLAMNGCADRVEVCDAAVSDAPGVVAFAEMRYDESGRTPYLPETSTLCYDRLNPVSVAERYDVPVVSLDGFFAPRPADAGRVRAVKVDVEGFEVNVLRGAARLLAAARPYLAIDIHSDPFTAGVTTEAACRELVGRAGYTAEKRGHVLLCTPPAGSA